RIHSNSDNLFHGRLPCLRFARTSFWHTDAVGGRPPHQPPPLVVAQGINSDHWKSISRGVGVPAFAGTKEVGAAHKTSYACAAFFEESRLKPDNDPSPAPFGAFAPNAAQATIL